MKKLWKVVIEKIWNSRKMICEVITKKSWNESECKIFTNFVIDFIFQSQKQNADVYKTRFGDYPHRKGTSAVNFSQEKSWAMGCHLQWQKGSTHSAVQERTWPQLPARVLQYRRKVGAYPWETPWPCWSYSQEGQVKRKQSVWQFLSIFFSYLRITD